MKHPFFVGGQFRDRNQGYEVISISDGSMVVRYDDGKQEKIGAQSLEIKGRIHNNILAEYRSSHPSTSDDYFWTLGYLSDRARFDAELPNHVVANFLSHYTSWSGETVTTEHPSVMLLGDVDKYGAELRIYFPNPPKDLDFGPGIEVRAGQTEGIKRVNNNGLWYMLVRIGFRVGDRHDNEVIRNSIPPDKRYLFDEGKHGA
ncbi:MAG: hypothetical protein IPG22_13800 [Acidobacteria bacterium]|nr:hypothetical protein [Acidobacteriota bacterium]